MCAGFVSYLLIKECVALLAKIIHLRIFQFNFVKKIKK